MNPNVAPGKWLPTRNVRPQAPPRHPEQGRFIRMAAATLFTGAAAGALGIALTLLLHLVQHLAFGYTENTFLIGVQRASGRRRVLALTAGGLLVGTAWWWYRRRIPQHAVSVTSALRSARPRLPFLATIADAVLQIVAVGAGASLGREGAPRQAGAASGGWIGDRLKVTSAQQRTLVAAGADAGLAAVYNVPLGGAAFTLEVLLGSFALVDVVPAVLCAAVATVLAWPVLGNQPTYRIPAVGAVGIDPPVLCWAIVLGPVAGIAGVLFTGLMTAARLHAPTGLRSVGTITAVFAGLGALAIGYPQLLGNGKGMAALALDGTLGLGLAGLLLVLKPIATAACLGAGAIGGLLTPSLATGAALGVFTGRLWSLLWPGAPLVAYAVVGAAALLAVTLRAPVTAVVLTLEFVRTAQALLVPMLVGVALATGTASMLRRYRAGRTRLASDTTRPGHRGP